MDKEKKSLERLSEAFGPKIEEKLIKINADTDCIEFFLEATGLKRSGEYEVPPLSQKSRNSYYRKIKRRLEKKYGEQWKVKWQEYKECMQDISKKGIRLSGIHGCTLKEPTKKKPKATPMHLAIVLLRRYFMYLTGDPHWRLIADILEPYYCSSKGNLLEYSDLSAWWRHNEKRIYTDLALDEETFFQGYYSVYKNLYKKAKG
jgi:hypothetical protein